MSELGRIGGSVKSARKAEASRRNGKLGGRKKAPAIAAEPLAPVQKEAQMPMPRKTPQEHWLAGNKPAYSPDGEESRKPPRLYQPSCASEFGARSAKGIIFQNRTVATSQTCMLGFTACAYADLSQSGRSVEDIFFVFEEQLRSASSHRTC